MMDEYDHLAVELGAGQARLRVFLFAPAENEGYARSSAQSITPNTYNNYMDAMNFRFDAPQPRQEEGDTALPEGDDNLAPGSQQSRRPAEWTRTDLHVGSGHQTPSTGHSQDSLRICS